MSETISFSFGSFFCGFQGLQEFENNHCDNILSELISFPFLNDLGDRDDR